MLQLCKAVRENNENVRDDWVLGKLLSVTEWMKLEMGIRSAMMARRMQMQMAIEKHELRDGGWELEKMPCAEALADFWHTLSELHLL